MKEITQSQLVRFVNLTTKSSYNEPLKDEYRKLGKTILKYVAEKLGLKKGEFDIRWNPGGIACSGDHVLHSDNIYIALHDNIGLGWFYWRTCKGRKDYTGGSNQVVPWTKLTAYGLEYLVSNIQSNVAHINAKNQIDEINKSVLAACDKLGINASFSVL